eukprot:CAMPEP_0184501092 /NCGR_PEP_ID=MMETSP0113_2-20130426/46665_1 /TAXON_ID=91329 /ORGANISM="Norrisiella sphaerica, Strain BC52" /LENGTH=62 /DNA_ID=CAMNT_0026889731 /DNA_START=168 /DNA_END=353 /DNA_ORIENTATION=-
MKGAPSNFSLGPFISTRSGSLDPAHALASSSEGRRRRTRSSVVTQSSAWPSKKDHGRAIWSG